jgi:hypothetical protein
MLEMDQAQVEGLTAALGDFGYTRRERFARPGAQPGSPFYGLFTPVR